MKTKRQPLHFTQAFDISANEGDLDFFDTNLKYDSLLFVDPFLIKSSPYENEKYLYKRITTYFKIAFEKSIKAKTDYKSSQDLLRFLSFPEPKEINLGYTKSSNEGSGLGGDFARALHTFFLGETAVRFFSKKVFEKEINPEFFILFADKVAQDGISDLTANLIMDYLVEYTQLQCKKWGIKTKPLKVGQTFDYEDTLDWTSGRFFKLPENPLKRGEPVVLVPKRFLRSSELTKANIKSKVKGILKQDPILMERFSRVLTKTASEIDVEEINQILSRDESALKLFINYLNNQKRDTYDFDLDPLEFYAYKKFLHLFYPYTKKVIEPSSCKDLLEQVSHLMKLFRKEYERRDGWKDAWATNKHGALTPRKEVAWGRAFRAAGKIYFDRCPSVIFDSEIESGRGKLDFRVAFKSCRITIELKLLKNNALTGDPKLPAYIHGIKRQLPEYSINLEADYAFYVTGQHYRETVGKNRKNHDGRANEIRSEITDSISTIKKGVPKFKNLFYVNIDLTQKSSFSKI